MRAKPVGEIRYVQNFPLLRIGGEGGGKVEAVERQAVGRVAATGDQAQAGRQVESALTENGERAIHDRVVRASAFTCGIDDRDDEAREGCDCNRQGFRIARLLLVREESADRIFEELVGRRCHAEFLREEAEAAIDRAVGDLQLQRRSTEHVAGRAEAGLARAAVGGD